MKKFDGLSSISAIKRAAIKYFNVPDYSVIISIEQFLTGLGTAYGYVWVDSGFVTTKYSIEGYWRLKDDGNFFLKLD